MRRWSVGAAVAIVVAIAAALSAEAGVRAAQGRTEPIEVTLAVGANGVALHVAGAGLAVTLKL